MFRKNLTQILSSFSKVQSELTEFVEETDKEVELLQTQIDVKKSDSEQAKTVLGNLNSMLNVNK